MWCTAYTCSICVSRSCWCSACVNTCRDENKLSNVFLYHSLFYWLETGPLGDAEAHHFGARLASQWALRVCHLQSLMLGVKAGHAQLFMWGLEIQTQVLLKHSYPLSNFPSPSTLFFEPGSLIVPTAQQITRLMYSKSLRDSGFCLVALGIQCMCQHV